MGGAWWDDHPDNIQAVHYWCNSEKGSVRLVGTADCPAKRTRFLRLAKGSMTCRDYRF